MFAQHKYESIYFGSAYRTGTDTKHKTQSMKNEGMRQERETQILFEIREGALNAFEKDGKTQSSHKRKTIHPYEMMQLCNSTFDSRKQ